MNSKNALQTALDSNDPYRIGIAVHMYTDTFAHQNFLGFNDSFNSLTGLSPIDIGHAEAGHKPDWPAAFWDDHRLVPSISIVDNKARFLRAVQYTYSFLKQGDPPDANEVNKLVDDVSQAIGQRDNNNNRSKERIKRYRKLINDFVEYDDYEWLDKAVAEERPDLPQPDMPYYPTYVWKPGYGNSDWFKFQMAVKEHQKLVVDEILKPIFAKMETVI